jgi:UDP-N-acetylmuramoylalanine--D-glutamate ligase
MHRVRPPLPEGPYLIVGLARSGLAAARVLAGHGEVVGVDSGAPEPAPEGFEAHLNSDGVELLDRAQTVVKSPGVPREAPVIAQALERGMPVLGELEISWRLLPNRFLAVTGTNGKTTTTELLGAVFRAANKPVAVAGNVGTPLAALVGETSEEATIVCEVSSFQAEDADAFKPEGALLLNLAEDHLDRHGTMEAYREAKLRVFARQQPGDVAVAPPGFELPGSAERVTFGGADTDLAVSDGVLTWQGEPLLVVQEVRLRGEHNLQNAMGAAALALATGVEREAVATALRDFAGVPHRLEEVGTVNGVLYVNDSKATNVDSAVRGIEAFEGGVHAILGGSLKGGGFEGLREALASNAKAAYLIGEAETRLAEDLDGVTMLHRCGTLEAAVQAATEAATPGDVVLLSPACASFDHYRDYEQRGDHFRSLLPHA